MEDRVFFTGGYDLEMQVIISLLEQHHEHIVDNHLTWENADICNYQKELSLFSDCDIYAIELRNNCHLELPPKYHLIDHHNALSCSKSSLEQVAEILDTKLSRYELLVAANDRGYIPAMIALEATCKEIDTIRYLDRKAQGVTNRDEELAALAITQKRCIGSVIVVYSETSHFSAITDQLYPYERLLIRSGFEIMYYGTGTPVLSEKFKEQIDKGLAFYGGGMNGYFGTASKAFNSQQLTMIENEIIKTINSL